MYASEYVYRTPGADDFTVYDICADPPRRLFGSSRALNGFLEPRDLVKGISAASWGGRHLVFMSDAAGGLWTIDATDPTSITWTAHSRIEPATTTPACVGDTAVAGSRLVVAGCGLAVLAMGEGATGPHLVGRLRHPPLASEGEDSAWVSRPAIVAVDEVLLVARMNALSTIEWRRDAAPSVAGQVIINPNGDQWSHAIVDVAAAGDRVWIADDHEAPGVFGFDVRDPRRPVRAGSLLDGVISTALAADETLLAVADLGSVQLFDVSSPAAPARVGSLNRVDPFPDVGAMLLADGRLYVASRAGLDTIDVSDPSAPSPGPFDHAAPLADAAVGDEWIVTLGRDAVRVYDRAAAKTGSLVPVARIRLPASAPSPLDLPPYADVNLGRSGDRTIAVVSNDLSLHAIDITDPTAPVFGVPYVFPVPSEWITVAGDNVFLMSYETDDLSRLDLGVLLVRGVLRLPYLANGSF